MGVSQVNVGPSIERTRPRTGRNYIAIDCAPSRLGYCYDAFHETASDLGYCQVITRSFTELITAIAQAGNNTWWLASDFKGYGYADELARNDSGCH